MGRAAGPGQRQGLSAWRAGGRKKKKLVALGTRYSPHGADMCGPLTGNDGRKRQEIGEDEIKQASTTAD